MGTSMEMILNAYMGLAKGNATMLDNLKIGYGGTQTEMLRLAKDMGVIDKNIKSFGDMSFDKAIEAIHKLQVKLGIAGTSAKEGTETIEGSMNRMKAAWSNLITGMSDSQSDSAKLTKEWLDTLVGYTDESGNYIKGALDNVLPAAERAIDSIGSVILSLGEKLAEDLPKLLNTNLPKFFDAITKLLLAFVKNFPSLLPAIIDSLETVVTGIINYLPQILDAIIEFLDNDLENIIVDIVDIIVRLIEELQKPEILNKCFELALKLVEAVLNGLVNSIPKILKIIPKLVETIVSYGASFYPKMAEFGVKLFVSLVSRLPEIITELLLTIPRIIGAIITAFLPLGEQLGEIFAIAVEGIEQSFSGIGNFFSGVWSGIQSAFVGVAAWFTQVFSEAWEGIKNVFSPVGEMFGNIGKSILNGISSVINGIIWGINQVIKVPFDGLNGILRLIHDIDIMGLKPFSWIGQIAIPQIPSIPMLAEGGVLKKGQIALLEGQGDEAVIPLSQNTEWIDKVADRLNEKSQSINYTINVEVANMNANSRDDIEKLAETLMQIMSEKTMRRGAAFR